MSIPTPSTPHPKVKNDGVSVDPDVGFVRFSRVSLAQFNQPVVLCPVEIGRLVLEICSRRHILQPVGSVLGNIISVHRYKNTSHRHQCETVHLAFQHPTTQHLRSRLSAGHRSWDDVAHSVSRLYTDSRRCVHLRAVGCHSPLPGWPYRVDSEIVLQYPLATLGRQPVLRGCYTLRDRQRRPQRQHIF